MFVKSSSRIVETPQDGLPEYLFVGRSNVGKSSLVNHLLGKDLAKISRTPGKTQLINHYYMQDWYLVDLPGYGYAKTSRSQRIRWQQVIREYILEKESVAYVFVLVDASLPLQAIDKEYMDHLVNQGVPFAIVHTKADKKKPRKLRHMIKTYHETLLSTREQLPPFFITSSEKTSGIEDIQAFIRQDIQAHHADAIAV